MKVNFFHIGLSLLLSAFVAQAQPKGYVISARNAESIATEEALRARVEFLTDTMCGGRVSAWVANRILGCLPPRAGGGVVGRWRRRPAGWQGRRLLGR